LTLFAAASAKAQTPGSAPTNDEGADLIGAPPLVSRFTLFAAPGFFLIPLTLYYYNPWHVCVRSRHKEDQQSAKRPRLAQPVKLSRRTQEMAVSLNSSTSGS
jgi:hypothetical protein